MTNQHETEEEFRRRLGMPPAVTPRSPLPETEEEFRLRLGLPPATEPVAPPSQLPTIEGAVPSTSGRLGRLARQFNPIPAAKAFPAGALDVLDAIPNEPAEFTAGVLGHPIATAKQVVAGQGAGDIIAAQRARPGFGERASEMVVDPLNWGGAGLVKKGAELVKKGQALLRLGRGRQAAPAASQLALPPGLGQPGLHAPGAAPGPLRGSGTVREELLGAEKAVRARKLELQATVTGGRLERQKRALLEQAQSSQTALTDELRLARQTERKAGGKLGPGSRAEFPLEGLTPLGQPVKRPFLRSLGESPYSQRTPLGKTFLPKPPRPATPPVPPGPPPISPNLMKLLPGGGKAPFYKNIPGQALSVLLLSKLFQTMLDISAPLRQGAPGLAAHPSLAGQVAKKTARTVFSEKNAVEIDNLIRADKDFDYYTRAGRFHATFGEAAKGKGPKEVEELRLGAEMGRKLPILGPLVRQAERTFVTPLNVLRHGIMKQVVGNWERPGWKGVTRFKPNEQIEAEARALGFGGPEALQRANTFRAAVGAESLETLSAQQDLATRFHALQQAIKSGDSAKVKTALAGFPPEGLALAQEEAAKFKDVQDFARFVNHLTLRGDLGPLEAWAKQLSVVFYAPRLVVAFPEMLADLLRPGISANVRRNIARDMAAALGTGMAILTLVKTQTGARVELNPRSSDFGKVQVGKTRINFWGGAQVEFRLIAQLIGKGLHAKRKAVTTGQTSTVSRYDLLGQFARQKLSPIAAGIPDAITRTDVVGRPVAPRIWGSKAYGILAEAGLRVSPLVEQDFAKAWLEQGWEGMALTIPAFFGTSVQTFEPPVTKFAREAGFGDLRTLPKLEQDAVEKLFQYYKRTTP